MKKFNNIVLSSTEPENHNDLWLKDSIEAITNGVKGYPSKSIWWFSPQGWKRLFDFDTRYNIEWQFEYEEQSDIPIEVTEKYDPTAGVVKVVNKLQIYDATRDLENNENLVNEIGLKWHVDDLQKKIDALDVSFAQDKLKELEDRIAKIEQSDIWRRV